MVSAATNASKAEGATRKCSALFPDGHFYSPVVDPNVLAEHAERLWPQQPETMSGIDLNDDSHRRVLQEWFPKFIADYDYPDHGEPFAPTGYFNLNDQFAWLDARTLFVFLRQFRPRRMIEVGSGYSSLLVADVNRRFLDSSCNFTCIEPYPRKFLTDGVPGITRLIQQKVENVDAAEFSALDRGDILFIDSSHIAKTGSDVLFLFFDVLPRLRPGVLIHVHDIFLPLEYPKAWAIDDNRSWNEQYLLRALLMFSTRFRVLFGCAYAATCFGADVVRALARPDGYGMGGGSLWIEVI